MIVLQNDKGNAVGPVTTIIPLTSRKKHPVPTHIVIPAALTGAPIDSVAMVEQVRVVDKTRLQKRLGSIKSRDVLNKIGSVLRKNLQI